MLRSVEVASQAKTSVKLSETCLAVHFPAEPAHNSVLLCLSLHTQDKVISMDL